MMAVERILVPVIDLAKFEEEKQKLATAVAELGCFRVINHGISEKIIADMKASAGYLLDLPTEVKQRNTDVIIGSGYVKPSHLLPFYEGFGIYDASSPTDIDAFCSQLSVSSRDRQVFSTFSSKLHSLISDLASKVAESLGIMGCSFQEWSCHLRMNRYNFTKETVGSCGVYAHTDHSFITILLEDESNPGLEIMDLFGNFVTIDSVPGTVLINIGDIGKVWSNGRLNNMKHRVICKKAEPRITIALFMLAPMDNKIEPHAELINSENPQLYRSFDYMEYRILRFSTSSMAGEVLHHLEIDKTISMN